MTQHSTPALEFLSYVCTIWGKMEMKLELLNLHFHDMHRIVDPLSPAATIQREKGFEF